MLAKTPKALMRRPDKSLKEILRFLNWPQHSKAARVPQPTGEFTLSHSLCASGLPLQTSLRIAGKQTGVSNDQNRVTLTLLLGPWSRISVYKIKITLVHLEGKMAMDP